MKVILFVECESRIESAVGEMTTLLAFRQPLPRDNARVVGVIVGKRALDRVKAMGGTPSVVAQELRYGARWDAWYVPKAEDAARILESFARCAAVTVHPVVALLELAHGGAERGGSDLGRTLVDCGRGRVAFADFRSRVAPSSAS